MRLNLFSLSSSKIYEESSNTIVEATTTHVVFEPSLQPIKFLLPCQAAAFAIAYFDFKSALWIQLGIIAAATLLFIKTYPVTIKSTLPTPSTPALSPIPPSSPQEAQSPQDPETTHLSESIQPKALFQSPRT